MDKLAVVAAAHAPAAPVSSQPPRRDIDVILATHALSHRAAPPGYELALRAQGVVQGHGTTTAASRRLRREVEQAERLADAGLIQFTALPEPRSTAAAAGRRAAAPARPWRCRLCQVECGGREGLREHCMSDEHYAGLQLFALHSGVFSDRPSL